MRLPHFLPRVGVGVLVFDGSKVLLGRRTGAHGAGSWAPPGGHLEFGESPTECARRELREETGLEVSDLYAGPFTNDIFQEEKAHYVTLFILAKYEGGTAENKDPARCDEWGWFEWSELPSPLFLPIQNLLRQGFAFQWRDPSAS